MDIKYVFGKNWPSKVAGVSFTTFTSYGIAKANTSNSVELIMSGKPKDVGLTLNNYFGLDILENFDVKFIDNKTKFSKTTKFYIKTLFYLLKLAKNKKLDVVITRKVGFLPYLVFLKMRYNIKIIYEAHDYYLNLKEKEKKHYKKKLFQMVFLKKVDGIICHQKSLENLYKKNFKNQNYLLARTGIKEIYKYNIKEIKSKKNMAYIGALGDRKDLETLFKALKNIEAQNYRLIIIGGTNEKKINHYKNLANEIGVGNKVEITGWVERKEIDEILKSVRIGLVPLNNNFFNRYLTSPMKIFNYFSHGIPVVGTDLPTIREIVGNKYGLLYKIGDVKHLSNKLNRLYNDDKLYMDLVKNINNFNEELLWKKRGSKILDFIKKI